MAIAIPASVLCIGRAGAGTNNIPVKTMSDKGVVVFNAPGANANAVSEHAIALILAMARRAAQGRLRGLSTSSSTRSEPSTRP